MRNQHTTERRSPFPRILLFTGLLWIAFLVAACGGKDSENVNLYVINGYAGSDNISLIGPTGTLVSNLKFGDRYKPDFPIEFNRNLGGEFTLLVDGAPQPFEVSSDLFALYPQETATMVVVKRSAKEAASMIVIRHIQTVSSMAILSIINGLSLSNTYADSFFSIIPEFRYRNPAEVGYLNESDAASKLQVSTTCPGKTLPFADAPPPLKRKGPHGEKTLYDAISANPWFFQVPCSSENGATMAGSQCAVWGRPLYENGPSQIGPSIDTIAYSNTSDYLKCLAGIIQPKKEEPGAGGVPTVKDVCKDNTPLVWKDMTIDAEGLIKCQEPKVTSLQALAPVSGQQDNSHYYIQIPPNGSKDVTFRFRTPAMDTIFGTASGTGIASQGDGKLIEITQTLLPQNQYHVLVYGRPVSPMLWQWKTSDSIAALPEYPGGKTP